MFRSSVPATAEWFHDREQEIARLEQAAARLRRGAPTWVAIIGARKVGKTSLLLELARRARGRDLRFVVLDAVEHQPLSSEFFRAYALCALDRTLGTEAGVSLERLARRPAEFRAALERARGFARIAPEVRAELLDLPEREADAGFVRACLDLPERIAEGLGMRLVVAIDEFQELADLAARRGGFDPFPVMRGVWQRHARVAYVISGSARKLLTDLIADRRSPFFQHFSLLDIGPFPAKRAVDLLATGGPPGRRIPRPLARRAVAALGGHPFYLQMLGEAITETAPPYDDALLKAAIQDLLFSRTGRLSLFFESLFRQAVGHSTCLAAVLDAVADGPSRLSEIASRIAATAGATASYIERLGDLVSRGDDDRYALADATFGLWLRWRRPGGAVVPMALVGDEAERRAAEHLARIGFDLVYQSRASRGSFDLLALRGGDALGVQVKRSPLPLRFPRVAWDRMEADAERFGWRWIVAAVDPGGDVMLLDPAQARRGRGVGIGAGAAIANLLRWVARG